MKQSSFRVLEKETGVKFVAKWGGNQLHDLQISNSWHDLLVIGVFVRYSYPYIGGIVN